MTELIQAIERFGSLGILAFVIVVLIPRLYDRVVSSNEKVTSEIRADMRVLTDKMDQLIKVIRNGQEKDRDQPA